MAPLTIEGTGTAILELESTAMPLSTNCSTKMSGKTSPSRRDILIGKSFGDTSPILKRRLISSLT